MAKGKNDDCPTCGLALKRTLTEEEQKQLIDFILRDDEIDETVEPQPIGKKKTKKKKIRLAKK